MPVQDVLQPVPVKAEFLQGRHTIIQGRLAPDLPAAEVLPEVTAADLPVHAAITLTVHQAAHRAAAVRVHTVAAVVAVHPDHTAVAVVAVVAAVLPAVVAVDAAAAVDKIDYSDK